MTQQTYDELSERLRLTEADREAWMLKYIKAVADLKTMEQCRNDAAEAARLIAEDLANRDKAIQMAESWGENGLETMDSESREKYEQLKCRSK